MDKALRTEGFFHDIEEKTYYIQEKKSIVHRKVGSVPGNSNGMHNRMLYMVEDRKLWAFPLMF